MTIDHPTEAETTSASSFSGKEELIALLSTMRPEWAWTDRDLHTRIEQNRSLLLTLPPETLQWVVYETSLHTKLLSSRHLSSTIDLLNYFDSNDGRVLTELIDRRESQQWFFSEAMFSHYLDMMGKDALRELFLFTTDENIRAKRYTILSACTHMSFPATSYFHIGTIYLSSAAPHVRPQKKITVQSCDERSISYLWGYASEVTYLKENCHIPLEVLLRLDKETLGTLCGTLRSLSNEALALHWRHQEVVDFSISKEPTAIDLDQVCSLQPILRLMYGHMDVDEHIIYTEVFERVSSFFTFLCEQSKLPHLPRLVTIDPHELRNLLLTRTKYQLRKRHTKRVQQHIKWEKINKQTIRKKHRLWRNYSIITSLAQTLWDTDLLTWPNNGQPKEMHSSLHLLRIYQQQIAHLAQKYAGLNSIGGKIHFPSAIADEKINAFKKQHWFDATYFKLIHANTSLLLPPSNFPEELLFMIRCIDEAGLIDNDPQLQISIPGRLPNHLWALLGSSMILLSEQHVTYTPESFGTTHESDTWRRMVVYDAGVYDNAFKRNSEKITWRTDVLLLKDVNLIPKAHVIGSLLSQTHYDGWYAQLGTEFIRDYCTLLEKYNLLWATQWPWIYDTKTACDEEATSHFQQVNALTEKQRDDFLIYNYTKQKKWLMVFELRNLLTTYWERIKKIQQHFICK